MVEGPYFAACPLDPQGVVIAVVTEAGALILLCDEEGHVWLDPGDIGRDRFEMPLGPDWSLSNGDHMRPGTLRLATMEEIRAAGWESMVLGTGSIWAPRQSWPRQS
jgi:hypothetical protein